MLRVLILLLFLNEEKVLLSKTSGSAGSKQKSRTFYGSFYFVALRKIAGKWFPSPFFSRKGETRLRKNIQLIL